jgi:hypothetical protein
MTLRILVLSSFAAFCALPAVAGDFFPCARAVGSANGDFVVILDAQPQPGQADAHARFSVFPRERFINAKDELLTPGPYWTDREAWSVVIESNRNEVANCPAPMITDDGEFLVLLHTGPAFAATPVLRIYRRPEYPDSEMADGRHPAASIHVALVKLWSPGQLAEINELWSDETPQWFAGGTFKFSSDSRLLIHKTRWHNTVRIALENGSVSME